MSQNTPQLIAMPGDRDLSYTLRGAVLESMLELDNELMLNFVGGTYQSKNVDGSPFQGSSKALSIGLMFAEYQDDKSNARVKALQVAMLKKLVQWNSQKTPLSIARAPGKHGSVSDEQGDYIILAHWN